jgi:hypothetical protein
MPKYKPYERLHKYYEQSKPYAEGLEVYQHDLAMNVASCLDHSDFYSELRGNTPEALLCRYEFRDGAAIMLASVYGLDIDMARNIMQTSRAYADYEQALGD